MGMSLGKPFSGFYQEIEPRIVLFGLDATGKSSIMHKLKTGQVLTINMPTIGFDVESIKYKDSTLSFWEMGGQQRYKLFPLWKHFIQEIAGLVFVVDSTDRDRIEEAKDFLNMVIDEIQGSVPDNVAVLVYGNKHEVPGAMSASEISNKLDLTSLRNKNWQRNWHVQSSCAFSGDGLHEGLDWLLKNAERI
ncbi:Small GTPase superfamily ARF/SAR type [Arabidopsis thaliana x Arabidopsis arenosa]|uniref:Small GTPase superfamily ARF/SAR type n=1 Tax=Arabidopsis thaliana x Arabidopsis arenosa TaxID=1240361 RepID=A0A8T1ZQ59_9BRAS|nr:Small GTPase superfamily ARF/SAR type [Arabidopsis thaliana x Arabidopsis arenosa]